MAEMKVFTQYSDVFSESIKFESFLDIIKGFERAFLLGTLIKIDFLFSENNYRSSDLHDFFLESLFNKADMKQLLKTMAKLEDKKRSVLVFSRQQIENLIRLVIAYSEKKNCKILNLPNKILVNYSY